jgi:hypothetical protein
VASRSTAMTKVAPVSRQPAKRRPLAIQSVSAVSEAEGRSLATENRSELVGRPVELVGAAPKARRQSNRRGKVKQEAVASMRGASKSRTAVQAAEWDAPQEVKTPRLLAGVRRKRTMSLCPK